MKDQIIATLSMEPLAIDEAWLEVLVETITKSTNIQICDPELLQALALSKGTKLENSNGAYVRNGVGVVYLSGPIFPKHNILTKWLGIGTVLPEFLSDVENLIESNQVNKIIISADSPGGSVTGINEGAEMLEAFSKIKPIITYTTGSNASACYWLTSAAGEIYADPTARIGSIGVMATIPNYKDDTVIEIVNSKSPKKNLDPATKEGRSDIVKVLDSLADVFIGSVAKGRGVSEDYVVDHFGQGGVLVGKQAVEAKMIDGVQSFESLMKKHSTNASVNHFTGKAKGDYDMELTLEKLKAEYPDVYQAACAEVKADLQAQIKTKNDQIKSLEDSIVDLEAKLEDKTKETTTLSDRVTALEKDKELANQKEAEAKLKADAASIADTTLKASSLPERVHAKIKKIIDFNSFVDDKGVLNAEGFKNALEAEIKDWESVVASEDAPVSGIAPVSGGDVEADDKIADRLFAYIS